MPNDGRIGLIYFANDRGRIVTEMSCMVHGDDDVGLITAATAQWHDAEHLWRNAPDGITVTDHTKEVECLLLTGPKARDILDPLTNGDLSRGWLTTQLDTKVAGKDCAPSGGFPSQASLVGSFTAPWTTRLRSGTR